MPKTPESIDPYTPQPRTEKALGALHAVTQQALREATASVRNPRAYQEALRDMMETIKRMGLIARSEESRKPVTGVDIELPEFTADIPLDIENIPPDSIDHETVLKEWGRLSYERDAAFEVCKKSLASGTSDEKRNAAQRLSDASAQLSDFEQKHGLQSTSDE